MTTTTPLVRSREDRLLGGVCAGLAMHLGLPVVWVRGGMLVFALFGGAGAIFYVWLWVTVPRDTGDLVPPMRRALTRPGPPAAAASGADSASVPAAPFVSGGGPIASGSASMSAVPASAVAAAPAVRNDDLAAEGAASPSAVPVAGPVPGSSPASHPSSPSGALPDDAGARSRQRWPVAELLLGGALLIAGIGLVLAQIGIGVDLGLVLPGMVVLVGVGLAWWQIADRDRPERHQLPRVLGALGLVAVGVLTFFVTARQPSALTVIAAALAVLAGVALALAPWVLRVNRDLIAERAGRAREAERAEIAAHLHDSVLQTLAAIQQRSEPGSDVARLARGQERELRDWLFRGADGAEAPARERLEVELRTHAVALEEAHAVRFEVVVVGAREGALAPESIVAAAREAMLNAARHAGGEVSVYAEFTPDRVAIDVTDRGPGIALDALPEGRMGVRESIVGRMERAGGTARIVPGPSGSGTSVRLAMPMRNPEPPLTEGTNDAGD